MEAFLNGSMTRVRTVRVTVAVLALAGFSLEVCGQGPAPPACRTDPPSYPFFVQETSLYLFGSFNGNGVATRYWFDWGTNSNYGNRTAESMATVNSDTEVALLITGLVPATTYQALRTLTGLRKGRTEARESEPVKPVSCAAEPSPSRPRFP